MEHQIHEKGKPFSLCLGRFGLAQSQADHSLQVGERIFNTYGQVFSNSKTPIFLG
jgi:hypothetical protein